VKQGIKFKTVDEYILMFPHEVRMKLETLRAIIIKAAPQSTEEISYNMPAYRQNKVLVYFAAYKNHIGLYPTASGIMKFKKEISCYKSSKGAVQFSIDEPLPLALIRNIVKFRVKEDEEKVKLKVKKK
jgi:uncharacterized protein YdhG (YjbR/CyaY superfamily)